MDGWIILNKPSGMASRKAGAICARMFNAKTFGHMGTLDPMASGLLPIALGQATKMIPFWQENQKKEYLFSLRFGFETDTLDITGDIVRETNLIPLREQVESVCMDMVGEIHQIPPRYSAVHLDGKRAHKLARAGLSFEMSPRKVTIYALDLVRVNEISWDFRVICSPGTYVRSVARDIAQSCGTLATVDMIQRVRTNGLYIKDAVKLDFLENLVNNGESFEEYLKPIDFGLGDIPVWNLDNKDVDLYKKGGFVKAHQGCASGYFRVYSNDKFIGVGLVEEGLLMPKRTLL